MKHYVERTSRTAVSLGVLIIDATTTAPALVTVKTGSVSVQGCTQANCASLQRVKTTHVETVPPAFLNPRQTWSASAHTGGLDSSALMLLISLSPGSVAWMPSDTLHSWLIHGSQTSPSIMNST
ncbi:uncharacterized protein WM277_015361 [Molossus nigricans]